MAESYTKEQSDFLVANAKTMRYSDLTSEFNQRFGTHKTVTQIRKWFSYHKISGISSRDLTPEQLDFVRQNCQFMSRKELARQLNEKFRTNFNENALKSYCNRRGLHSVSTGKFEVGNRSWQTGLHGEDYWRHFTPETREQVRQTLIEANTKYHDGDVIIRHGLPCIYKKTGATIDENISYASTVIWEQHYGKIPDSHIIIHIDGNVMNYDISNLYLFPRSDLSTLRHLGGLTDNVQLNRTKLMYCKLIHELR